MTSYLAEKESIISELNKYRETQMELINRRNMLKEYLDIASSDYANVDRRVKEISDKIQKLKDRL